MSYLKTPSSLPLLEALCWNIKNPYNLTPSEILNIYERYWRFKDVLGEPSPEEIKFINQLTTIKGSYSLVTMTKNKQQHYQNILVILKNLNLEFLRQCEAYLGGGTLINLETDCFRYSADIDFICSTVAGYKLLRQRIFSEGHRCLFKDDLLNKEITLDRMPKIDRYGIRFPILVSTERIPIKLGIITETRVKLGNPLFPDWNKELASLNIRDRYVLKLMANSDRYLDKSVYSRDLIDLTMLRNNYPLPSGAILTAEAIYGVTEQLVEAITLFQKDSEYRENCYRQLQIEEPYKIINGLDLLAQDLALETTERTKERNQFFLFGMTKTIV